MLITILLVLVLILSIVMITIGYRKYFEVLTVLGLIGATASAFILIACAIGIICTQANIDLDYQNKLDEKEMLEYRIEQGSGIVGNELLYSQVVEFNNELRSTKKWANSPWFNWYNNKKIATIDYIVIEELGDTNENNA